MKKIAVDIDNTLWDFSPVFWERLQRIDPGIMPPTDWTRWDFWENHVTKKQVYRAVKEIHLEQERFQPFDDAQPFLETLKKRGFYIIIASHREAETHDATMRLPRANGLMYDEIHLSNDKSIMFRDLCADVDGSALVLDKAKEGCIVGVGIRRPWDAQGRQQLFETLPEVLAYLESLWGDNQTVR